MIDHHVLEPASFTALAAGKVDSRLARRLFAAQLSEYHLLAAHVLSNVPATGRLHQAVEVLSRSQEREPDLVADLCHETWWGAWAARCFRGLAAAQGATDLEPDAAHLGAFAAVAAHRTGLDAETWTMVRDGRVPLPGLGVAQVCAPERSWARLSVSSGRIAVHCDGEVVSLPAQPRGDSANWLSTRRLRAEHGGRHLTLLFDDLDPYRDCYGISLADRVSDAHFQEWLALLSRAWSLLSLYAGDRANELSTGLRVLVPLAAVPGQGQIIATAQDALGAVAMTAPSDPARFAVTLVHERAHSTLIGLLNLVSLHDPEAEELYFAPWRPDPRPIGALLHGAYAFLAVTDTWLALSRDAVLRQTSEHEFALHRAQLDPVMDSLASAESLTAAGQVFVACMRAHCDSLRAAQVAPVTAVRAQELVRAQHAEWRQRNRRPAGRLSPTDRSASQRTYSPSWRSVRPEER